MSTDNQKPPRTSRRDFVIGALGVPAAFVWDSAIGVLQVDSEEAPKLISNPEVSPDSGECWGLSRLLLGENLTKLSTVRAKGNPHYGDITQKSPSSLHAMQVVIERLGLTLETVQQIVDLTTLPEGLVMSFGGPFNNEYTRAIFGTGAGSPLLSLLNPQSGILPVMFDIENPLPPLAGNEPAARVLIEGFNQEWSDDCLVLTVLPNPYSSLDGPHERIEIIAARHRAGMMATSHVFSNAPLLERIAKKTHGWRAWQALIPVQTIDQKTPRELGQERVFEIKADFDALRALVRGKPFLTDPNTLGADALLGSVLAVRQRAELDRKSGRSGKVTKDTSPSETKPIRSGAASRSGEGARTAAPHEEQMRDPKKYRWYEHVPPQFLTDPVLKRLVEEKRNPVTKEEWTAVHTAIEQPLAEFFINAPWSE